MARRKRLLKVIIGVLIGVLIPQLAKKERVCERTEVAGETNPPPERSLLFVGVLTAAKYLDTRAAAVHATWARDVPGKVVFFSSEASSSDTLPLVALPDVDDSYPPQKKSFMMLKYMYDNYIDQYEWFLRADDDVYVRADRLHDLLRSVDSKKPWFIGQTGRGNTEEFGMLSLENDENFCMGGPGVIFSRETLKRIAPHVEECLGEMYTAHEDVELGRCVRRFAGVACTWSYEMQVILYHNQSGAAAFTGDLKQKEVHRAITLHPIKQPGSMYRLDKYVKSLKIQEYQQESLDLHRDIASFMSELGFSLEKIENATLVESMPLFTEKRGSRKFLGDTRLLGVPQTLTRNSKVVLDWELISKTLYTSKDLNPRRRFGSSLKEGLGDVVRDIMEVINSYSKQRGRVIDFKEILYGYWRLDVVHGVDLILDLLLVYRKYRGRKMTVQVRRHAYVQQTFTGLFIREVKNHNPPSSSHSPPVLPLPRKIVKEIISTFDQLPLLSSSSPKKEVINFILPLSGRHAIFRRFMKTYENSCLRPQEDTRLFVVLYSGEDAVKSSNLIAETKTRFPSSTIIILPSNETFSRALALDTGARHLGPEDLMVFVDVDMVFHSRSLLRIRANTVRAKTVYFPIVYSLYNPQLLPKSSSTEDFFSVVSEDTGFWRQFGFGIVSLYKSDYVTLGGLDVHISGWGFEDVSFFDTVVKSKLKIVRVVDPDLIHVYHSIDCDINLDSVQRSMCLGTQANMLGSLRNLQNTYLKNKNLLD